MAARTGSGSAEANSWLGLWDLQRDLAESSAALARLRTACPVLFGKTMTEAVIENSILLQILAFPTQSAETSHFLHIFDPLLVSQFSFSLRSSTKLPILPTYDR